MRNRELDYLEVGFSIIGKSIIKEDPIEQKDKVLEYYLQKHFDISLENFKKLLYELEVYKKTNKK